VLKIRVQTNFHAVIILYVSGVHVDGLVATLKCRLIRFPIVHIQSTRNDMFQVATVTTCKLNGTLISTGMNSCFVSLL